MTRKEHLKKLPLQKRLQATENIRKYSYECFLEMMYQDIDRHGCLILSGSFIFSDTRQGHDYWMNIDYNYFGNL